ncbi:4-hydroxybutyrate CoA-transferase [Nonlabens spongiae]|uniref:4-hydroxybutyrate CoA-transferase n=1 Tax=Nonlabens spongiae TaxID=331648 RepID=A0A1W6MJA5_9FLAO|nr:acetyl-CoA hydrolase/transferase C-terminal domain-containing protein [Nonlabens spongiae]ARN77694.1 4-hydroxybutyrate CoA-transferase [Nonlabens spongiae]
MSSTPLKLSTPEQAAAYVSSGDRVFIQGAAMTPDALIDALASRHKELNDVELISIHTEKIAPYTQEPYKKAFKVNSCFVGRNVRESVNTGNGGYIPVFLSEIHHLFRQNILPLDVAFVQVSPPDKHGYCSLGTSVDVTLPAVQTAKIVIAQINKHVPRSHGDGTIHRSQIHAAIENHELLPESHSKVMSEVEARIGKHIANLIEDGATLQMGIGNIPNAVLSNLNNHKGLGIHTEMFSDGVLPLVENGVITGEHKAVKVGKITTCFAVGTQKLYDFIDDNPLVHFKEAAYTNDTALIRRNPKVTAINSAIELDLTGQVCADTIGMLQFSGVGGQMDFIRGAALSKGGKPIMALPSVTRHGDSKIVPFLKKGAGVTTTRAHVHWVVTEYGAVNLFGRNLKERSRLLQSIAHPDHRDSIDKAIHERYGSNSVYL